MSHLQSPNPPAELLSVQAEAQAFWRMRRRVTITMLGQMLSSGRFRLSLILLLSLLLWMVLFYLFADGFWFVKTAILHPETYEQTVGTVFATFFIALMVMLIFSSGIILYGSLFRSPEVAFLLTVPVRIERVFLHKFQEAVLLSSWGFLLLGSPMLIAYGIVAEAPWYYFLMLVLFMVAFVYIPAAIGAILCLWIIYRLPGSRLRVLLGSGILLLLAATWALWSVFSGPRNEVLAPSWFRDVLGRLKFADGRLLPSWWLSSGLLEAARNVWSESVLFLALMISNALFFRQLAIWTAGSIYRPAYSALYGRHAGRKRRSRAWVDRALLGLTGPLSRQARLLMVKDLRLFRRDPVQWSQFLIFFGLLALYFFNIRHFGYEVYQVGWVNMVSFLNLSVVGLLMATFTTRFIFPMVSLEGRHFWVLGLLPVRRDTILWGKFFFAVGASILPCSALILLSDTMLGVSGMVIASHQLTCLILCVGLSGIAVGLGARLPNLREQSPSRIAAGFGGTLNLVLSTAYILAVVMLTALPCHFCLVAEKSHAGYALAASSSLHEWLQLWLLAGTAASILLGVLATIIPLAVGFRAFRRLEF